MQLHRMLQRTPVGPGVASAAGQRRIAPLQRLHAAASAVLPRRRMPPTQAAASPSPSNSPASTTKQTAARALTLPGKGELAAVSAASPRRRSASSSSLAQAEEVLNQQQQQQQHQQQQAADGLTDNAADPSTSGRGPAAGRLGATLGAANARWDAMPSRYKVLAGGFMSFVICNMVRSL